MKQLFLLFIPFLLISCSHETLEDGKYFTITNSFVYGIEVNKAETEARLYLLNELSADYSLEDLKTQQDWSTYRIGTLQKLNEFNWTLLGLDTDVKPFDRPENLNLSIGPDYIRIGCHDMYDMFLGKSLNMSERFCKTDSITFFKLHN